MNTVSKEIEKAVRCFVLEHERDAANGTCRTLRLDQPWDEAFALYNIAVLNGYAIACDGKLAWKVGKRYSARKSNGCYQPLKPTLERVDLGQSGIEALLREKGVPQRRIDRVLGR